MEEEFEDIFKVAFEKAMLCNVHVSLVGTILMVNQKFANFLGYEKGELLATDIWRYVYLEDRSVLRSSIQELFTANISCFFIGVRFVQKRNQMLFSRIMGNVIVPREIERPFLSLWVVGEEEWNLLNGLSSTSPGVSYKKRPKPLLTKREREIATLISKGLSNKAIAHALFLSPETVKKHIYRIFQKLDVHNRVEMLNKLKKKGLLP